MPYNNAAIPPSEDITGTTVLPLARVKKILAADEDLGPVSSQAAFVIAKAAELFVQHLAEKSFDRATGFGKKVKRSLTYNDIASTVARLDHLEFLVDTIPETITYGEYKERKAREKARNPGAAAAAAASRPGALPPGQTTLDGPSRAPEVAAADVAGPLDGPAQPPPGDGFDEAGGAGSGHATREPNGAGESGGKREAAVDGDGDVAMA